MSNIIVTVHQGKLSGTTQRNYNGEKIYKFQGIPYAKPPVGELRFKDPIPPEKWNGIYDATKERDGCYAPNFFDMMGKVSGSEDCLYLNVYTKELPNGENKPKPVMVYIHGGGYIFGPSSSDVYGPDFLMTEDIVLVVITYRLGLLGFLSLDDPALEVPGNAAFKDMVMALKWVQANIANFNGDKNNVTIFGESAGAGSVHLLMLSPLSKGLVHRVIAQSGSALNSWARGSNSTKLVAAALGIPQADEQTVLNSLMKMPVEEIFLTQQKLGEDFSTNYIRTIGYVIEPNHPNAFLTEDPIDIILNGRAHNIPFMTGYTSLDGYGLTLIVDQLPPSSLPEFERDLPHQLGYKMGEINTKEAAKKLKEFYFGKDDTKPKNLLDKINKATDVMFLYFQYVAIKNHSQIYNRSSYFYRMSVETKLNLYKTFRNIQVEGAVHVDDLGYLFKNFTTPEIKPNSLEEITMRRFVKLWTNFAKYGNPTPNKNDDLLNNVEWKPVQGETINFLDIGPTLVPGVNPEKERVDFWRELFAHSPSGKKYV